MIEGGVLLRGDQRQRAERAAARVQRDADRGAQTQLVDDPAQLLVVADQLLEQLLGQIREELGLAGPDHLGDPVRVVRVRRIALLQLVGPQDLLGVVVCDGEPLDLAVGHDHVDRAPVG